jgi:hypothetical protein
MSKVDEKTCWRTSTLALIDIGRTLSEIEQNLRRMQATAVVSNEQAARTVRESLAAARKLVRALAALKYTAEASAFEDVE